MDKEQAHPFPDSHRGVFFRRFITRPRQIGSIMPSSPALVDKMLSFTDWNSAAKIAELGAGTGVVTEEILRRVRRDAVLSVFELDSTLRQEIESSLKITVYPDACDLPRIFGPQSLDLVVSSLPWTTLPKKVSANILHGILTCLKPGGQFIAYQYSRHMRRFFRQLFQSVEISFVLKNIPPAFVYNCNLPLPGADEKISHLFNLDE